jgi:hypothetical protein
MSEKPISPLRRRMIEDMSVRKFGDKTQNDYIRHIENFAKFLGRSPDTATAEDLRRYQVHQTEAGVQPPSVNSSAVALRFLFHAVARPCTSSRCSRPVNSRVTGRRRRQPPSGSILHDREKPHQLLQRQSISLVHVRPRSRSPEPLSSQAREAQIGVKLPLPSVPSRVASTAPPHDHSATPHR